MLLKVVDRANCGLRIAERKHPFLVPQHLWFFASFVKENVSHVFPIQVQTRFTSREVTMALVLEIIAVLVEVRVGV